MNIFNFTQKLTAKTDAKEKAVNTPLSFKQQSEETAFANEQLNRLLERYKEVLAEESNETRMNLVKKWSAAYPRVALETQAPALNPQRTNPPNTVTDLKDRARLAADELHRLENEGGPPPSAVQADHAEKLIENSAKLTSFATDHRNDKLH